MENILSSLSHSLADVVAQAAPGVVRVEARRQYPASGAIWSADGVIVTAHHILEQEDNLRVGLHDGRVVAATLVGRDPTTDLAVLRAQISDLKAPTWAEPDSLRVGHLVLALGLPGQTVRAALGVVSALGESWVTPAGGRLDHYLQTDVVMYPGFSGGPLVNVAGEVLGLNTSALLRGVSITVPFPSVRRVVETLLVHGRVSRGYLGVGTQPVRLPTALAQQLGQETALLVVSVDSSGPAEKGGLLLGDAIVAIAGQAVRSIGELLVFLVGAQVGAAAPVRIVRGGQLLERTVTIGERP